MTESIYGETHSLYIAGIISVEGTCAERCALLRRQAGRAIVKKCRRNIVHDGERIWNMVPSNKVVVLLRKWITPLRLATHVTQSRFAFKEGTSVIEGGKGREREKEEKEGEKGEQQSARWRIIPVRDGLNRLLPRVSSFVIDVSPSQFTHPVPFYACGYYNVDSDTPEIRRSEASERERERPCANPRMHYLRMH